jgi:Mrp family chromosome partitioning ATPase
MSGLLDRLRAEHDLVLLDTPPLIPVADVLTLVPLVDEVALLIDSQKTPRRAVADALQMLRRSGARVVGAVLTKVDLRRQGPGYGNYGYLAEPYTGSAPMRVAVEKRTGGLA